MIGHETPRLLLRELRGEDAPFVFELLNDADFLRYIGDRHVRNLAGARSYISNGPVRSYRDFGFGLLLMQAKDGGESIGMCGLVQRNYFPDPDLGFALLPRFRSQGFCSEAGRSVLNHAHDIEGRDRVMAVVQPENAASIGVLRKLGFVFERNFKASAADNDLDVMTSHRCAATTAR